MLLNCDKYRREDSDGAYVIALDSPWGTGKTRFVKMLRNHLEDRTSEAEKNRPVDKEEKSLPPGKGAEFNVIYYNAWDTDFCENALEPLLSTIVNSDVFEDIRKDAKKKEIWKGFVRFAKGALDSSVDIVPAVTLIGFLIKVFYAGIKRASEKPEAPFAAYEEQKETYRKFADHFEKVISATGKSLLIIVDELDRCRPTFAIQTLELAKHLFDVTGLIFIFALDTEQLRHSVKTVYGQDFDAPGYLCRFFNYLGKLPSPNSELFVRDLVFQLNPEQRFYKEDVFTKILVEYIVSMQKKFSLSLRDLTTIISTYKIIFSTFLWSYPDACAHELYILLLCLKFKQSTIYRKLCDGEYTENERRELITEPIVIMPQEVDYSSARLQLLGRPERIKHLAYITRAIDNKVFIAERRFEDFFVVTKDEVQQLCYHLQGANNAASVFELSDIENLGQVLFPADLKKWEEIKDLTLGQYYYRQLEMFDFVLLADEAKTEL